MIRIWMLVLCVIAVVFEVQEDPELKPVFEEMRAGGMGAMMK